MHFKKSIVAFMATMMMLTGMAVPMGAMAANAYTPVAGTSTTFKKFLIMSQGDNVPNVTFNYTIAPGEAVSADTSDPNNTVFQVLPGVNADKITITPTIFAPGNGTKTTIAQGDIDIGRTASERATGLTANTGVEFNTGEKYAVQTATVGFTGVTFDEPGVYRYIITETTSDADENRGIMHDNDIERVLDVYVIDDAGALKVAGYVLHTDLNADNVLRPVINTDMGTADVTATGTSLSDKTDGFTNEYKSIDLEFKKEVEGNEASKDKWFEFTLNVNNLTKNDQFTVSIADDENANTNDGYADATSGTTSATRNANRNKTNTVLLTADANGNINGADGNGVKFYLQHGQSIVVRGLPQNAKYTVTEDKEDYKSTPKGVSGYTAETSSGDKTISEMTASSVHKGTNKLVRTSYKNTRDGAIPTGVKIGVGAFAIAVISAAGIVAYVMLGRKRRAR